MAGAGGGSGVREAVRRAGATGAAAGGLWLLGRDTAAFALFVAAVAVLIVGLAAPVTAAQVDNVLRRVSETISHAIGLVLSALAWALLVLPLWAVTRAVGHSPLDLGWATPKTNWVRVGDRARRPDGRPAHPERMGAVEPQPSDQTRRRSRRRLLALAPLVVVALLVAIPPLLRRYGIVDSRPMAIDLKGSVDRAGQPGAPTATVPPNTPIPKMFNGVPVDGYAHAGEPWAAEHLRAVSVAKYFPDYTLGIRPGDFSSPYLNVEEGRRVTYTPAGANLTVWFFGGSTMFGIGQRDEGTIPSVVAKLAERDGIRIRALNFGASGYVNWQETVLMAQKLSELPKPDLVVFYDGVNDRGTATYRVDDGSIDPSVIERLPLSPEERRNYRASLGNPKPMPFGPDRTELEINLAANQYRRGVETARALARAYVFPILNVWQPQPFAMRAKPADQELYRRLAFDPANLADSTRTYAEIRRRSGVDPIDLTGALDEIDDPVFFDSSHTNELGARIVATELYRRIKPDLAKAAGNRR